MPATLRYVDAGTATVYERGADGKKKRLASLFWGDSVKVIGKLAGDWKLDFTTRVWDATQKKYIWKKHDAFVDGDVAFRNTPLLKVHFVDVGQGNGKIGKRRMCLAWTTTERSPLNKRFATCSSLSSRA